jgi:hypothetical protein
VLPNITWAGTQAGVPVSVPPGLLPPSNGLLLSPQQLTLAKSVGRFLSLRVSVKAVSALGDVVLGSAAQAIELLDLDVNMVLRGPAYVFTVAAEDRTTKVVFDSSASCDPNKFGLGCVGTPNNVSVYYYSGTSPSIEYLAPGQLPGQFTWQLYEHVGVDNITLAQMGIYEFLVSDTFSQAGQFRMTVTGSPSSTNEANVNAVWYFTVLDPKIGCTLPELQMPVFPLSSITLQPPSVTLPDASPFFIRASVNDFGIPGVQYSWNESSDAINVGFPSRQALTAGMGSMCPFRRRGRTARTARCWASTPASCSPAPRTRSACRRSAPAAPRRHRATWSSPSTRLRWAVRSR